MKVDSIPKHVQLKLSNLFQTYQRFKKNIENVVKHIAGCKGSE